jgi:hypothetical protein
VRSLEEFLTAEPAGGAVPPIGFDDSEAEARFVSMLVHDVGHVPPTADHLFLVVILRLHSRELAVIDIDRKRSQAVISDSHLGQ